MRYSLPFIRSTSRSCLASAVFAVLALKVTCTYQQVLGASANTKSQNHMRTRKPGSFLISNPSQPGRDSDMACHGSHRARVEALGSDAIARLTTR